MWLGPVVRGWRSLSATATEPRILLRPLTSRQMREVTIRGESIRLGALLKLAGVVGSGGEAKALLAAGTALVNGEPESRRGRQLRRGDIVQADRETLRVV